MDNTLDNVLHCKAAVKGAWGVPQQVTETALLYIRKHCLHALGPLQGHTTFNESLVCYTPPGMDPRRSGLLCEHDA